MFNVILFVLLLLTLLFPRVRRFVYRRKGHLRVAFLHPYCNAGGGGERVLWVWVRYIQERMASGSSDGHGQKWSIVVYTGDELPDTEKELARNVKNRFNLDIDASRFSIVSLRSRWLVEASTWPRFTLLGQSLGSVLMAGEALFKHSPDLLIDSMGYSFAVATFKLLVGCRTCSYVHYPTISVDMIQLVHSGKSAHNNAQVINSYPILKSAKLIYYKLFAKLYGIMGRRSDIVFTNSSWTNNHIKELWNIPDRTFVVYPPCDLNNFFSLKLERAVPPYYIVSVAQFRPEKDHALQIRALKVLLEKLSATHPHFPLDEIQLDIVGSVRHEADERLLEGLRHLARELQVETHVQFSKNVSFSELLDRLQRSVVGLHTMWNEHFGIGVVEMMASGCIVIAHNSGGPKLDIVTPEPPFTTGFLADSPETYAEAMLTCLTMSEEQRQEIGVRARSSIARFSESAFENSILDSCEQLRLFKS